MNAFLLDIFSKTRKGNSPIYGLGKLENEETFGFIDTRILPGHFSPGSGEDSGSGFRTMTGEPVRLMTFPSVVKQRQEARRSIESGIPVFNENVTYPHQYLISRGLDIAFSISGRYRSSDRVDRVYENPEFSGSTWLPEFGVLSFDIETDGKGETILGISYCFAAGPGVTREEGVFVLDQGNSGEQQEYVIPCKDEPELLHAFISMVNRLDPDILTGWNVIDFDLAVLAKKAAQAGVPFTIGRSRDQAKYLVSEFWGGSRAKSYAGLKQDASGESLEITGMEAVRSDWTPAARELQTGLLLMMFQGKSTEELDLLLSETIQDIRSGRMDDKLVYSKRLRKSLASYTKTSPPHVKAARLLPSQVRTVRYVITLSGPQPLGFQSSPIDYDHYVQKQILPVAESLSPFTGLHTTGYTRDDYGQQELF